MMLRISSFLMLSSMSLWATVVHADALDTTPVATHDPAGHIKDTQHAVEFLAQGDFGKGEVRTERMTLTVEARGGAVQSSWVLNPGDVIRVRPMKGKWTVDKRTFQPVGVEGHVNETGLHKDWGNRREVTRLPFGRLLLRVGGGPWVDAASGQALKTLLGGPLEFHINDNDDSLTDNEGSVDVELTVERRGIPDARRPVVKAPAPPEEKTCPDSLCGPGQRCVLHQVQCVTAPCPPQRMCVPLR
jgi:hypothetical protein